MVRNHKHSTEKGVCMLLQNTCSNPDCQKTYQVSEKDDSMGCCSFDCWEKVYCGSPQEVVFEDLTVPS